MFTVSSEGPRGVVREEKTGLGMFEEMRQCEVGAELWERGVAVHESYNPSKLKRTDPHYGFDDLLSHESRSSSLAEQRSSGFHVTIFRMNFKNRALSAPSKISSDCSRLSSGKLVAPIQLPEA